MERVVCGCESGVVIEPAVSGGSAAGELAGGLKLSCGACHSPDPLIIPSLPCLSGSKGPESARTRWSPDATPWGPQLTQLHVDRRWTQRVGHLHVTLTCVRYIQFNTTNLPNNSHNKMSKNSNDNKISSCCTREVFYYQLRVKHLKINHISNLISLFYICHV